MKTCKYCKRPEVKERMKLSSRRYYHKPEVKARQRKYKKEYFQRPEVIERVKKYQNEYKKKQEVKERTREYRHRYNDEKAQIPMAKRVLLRLIRNEKARDKFLDSIRDKVQDCTFKQIDDYNEYVNKLNKKYYGLSD